MAGPLRKNDDREREYTGAAFLGWFRWFGTNATVPFGMLRASAREVTVRISLCGWGINSVTLRREEVLRVGVERRLCAKYLRFFHEKRGAPEFVMFWAWTPETVLNDLRALGYPVE